MTAACPVIGGPDDLVSGLVGLVDCRIALIAKGGYLGVAGSDLYAALVTGLLTILVAIQGYRLLAGSGPALPDALGTILRIGFVLALNGSWTAYQTVVYRTAIEGPGEIADLILPAAGLGRAALTDRLQLYYDTIRTPPAAPAPSDDAPPGIAGAQTRAARDGRTPTSDTSGMSVTTQERESASNWFVAGTVGPLLAMRVALAFLLALGPLALVTLLFEASAGIFRAWVRTLAGAGIAWIGLTACVVMELEALEGILVTSVSAQSYTIPGVMPVISVFLLMKLAITLLVFRVMAAGRGWRAWPAAFASRRADPRLLDGASPIATDAGAAARAWPGRSPGLAVGHPVPTQAQAISAVLEASVRRRAAIADGRAASAPSSHGTPAAGALFPIRHDRGSRRRGGSRTVGFACARPRG